MFGGRWRVSPKMRPDCGGIRGRSGGMIRESSCQRLEYVMRRLAAVVISIFIFLSGSSSAEAKLEVLVDKPTQQMWVVVDGKVRHVWSVSTGRGQQGTPNGTYTPERMERMWRSRAYYQSPMPYSIFFHKGYAIHGSYAISQLGGPASHGCVRLHPDHAAILFALVEQEGPGNTTIVVRGENPARPPWIAGDMDRRVGSVVDEPPDGLRVASRPGAARLSRPADRDVVDLMDRRDDLVEARLSRVPQAEQIGPNETVVSGDRLVVGGPARLRHRLPPEGVSARSGPAPDTSLPLDEETRSGRKLSLPRVPPAEPIEPKETMVSRDRVAVAGPARLSHRPPAERVSARSGPDRETSLSSDEEPRSGHKLRLPRVPPAEPIEPKETMVSRDRVAVARPARLPHRPPAKRAGARSGPEPGTSLRSDEETRSGHKLRLPRVPPAEQIEPKEIIVSRDRVAVTAPARLPNRLPAERASVRSDPDPSTSPSSGYKFRPPRMPQAEQIEPNETNVSRDRVAVAGPVRLPPRLPAERANVRSGPDSGTSPPSGEKTRSGYKLLPKSYWSGAAWRWR